MQNNITNTMDAIKSIDDPAGQLQKWINAAQKETPGMSTPFAMSAILNAKLKTSGGAWNKAADTAQTLLNGIANSVEMDLPPNTEINQKTIDRVAQTKSA